MLEYKSTWEVMYKVSSQVRVGWDEIGWMGSRHLCCVEINSVSLDSGRMAVHGSIKHYVHTFGQGDCTFVTCHIEKPENPKSLKASHEITFGRAV